MINKIDEHLASMPLATIKAKRNKFNQLLVSIIPILEFAVPLLFFKPKWQAYLRNFITFAKIEAAQIISLDSEELSGNDTDGDGIDDWQDDDADGDGIDWLTDPNDPRHGRP